MNWCRGWPVFFVLLLFPSILFAHCEDLRSAPPLKGSLAVENKVAKKFNLTKIEDAVMLKRFVRAGLLIRIPPSTDSFWLDVPRWRSYARPWAGKFLKELSDNFAKRFSGKRLKITSLIRPARYQRWLEREDISDADGRSTHPTGSALDISRRPMTEEQILWMRCILGRRQREGRINAIEEFRNNAFHVMVFPPTGFKEKSPS